MNTSYFEEAAPGLSKQSLILTALAALTLPLSAPAQTVEQKLETMQREIDSLKSEVLRRQAPQSPDTSIFGYGEFNYNRYRDADRTTKADLRRFVIGFGHRFNDELSFQSEVEIEHAIASAGDRGEVEMEQAYLNYRFSDAVNVKGGLFLIPLGILNETHEPPTYYGVERNEVETRIIPTTWRELGFGVHGLLGQGFRYDLGLTTGFNSGKLDDPNTGIRSGHQEGQAAYHAYQHGNLDVAPFARIEHFEIRQQEDAALGVFQDPNNIERVRTLGVNFKIHPQVVLKTDIQRYSTDKTKDRFNVGLGYMF